MGSRCVLLLCLFRPAREWHMCICACLQYHAGKHACSQHKQLCVLWAYPHMHCELPHCNAQLHCIEDMLSFLLICQHARVSMAWLSLRCLLLVLFLATPSA